MERVSLARWRPGNVHPYWATTREVATILGVNRQRVLQLVAADLVPAVRHGRRWVFRRHQLMVIGNARDARWHPGRPPLEPGDRDPVGSPT